MLPRILRVTRAKNIRKTASSKDKGKRHVTVGMAIKPTGTFTRKVSSEAQSLSGRAGKLLGRAGAAQIHGTRDRKTVRKGKVGEMAKPQELMVFEGYRASSKQGKGTMKMGGSGKKQGKPRTRSSRRGAEFKRSGGKKGKA
jgi:nucleolar protein 12